MREFDSHAYGTAVAGLIDADILPELGPGEPHGPMRARLAGLDDSALFSGRPVQDPDMAACCRSALWLFHDFLDESHQISQTVETATGSYWHGIMHRREPDYSNAKYWFRRVGSHAVFPAVCEAARVLASRLSTGDDGLFLAEQSVWDPFAFIDYCQQIAAGRSAAETLARRVALLEWQVLFDHCWTQAVGVESEG